MRRILSRSRRARPSILRATALAGLVLAGLLPIRAPLAAQSPGAPAAGAPDREIDRRIERAVERVGPEMIEIRHRIHRNPELGNRETETAALVAGYLRELGLEVTTGVAHTGVVGVLEGAGPGPVVAVRADMDALPVTEQTDLPFASTERTTYLGQEVGVAHACGHDVHTSVGLGTAAVLASLRDELPGTVVFLFQPAEEGPPPGEEGGAELMLDEGVFERFPRPDAIFGLHSFPDLAVGQVGVNPGPTMASVDHFVAIIQGKQAHGAYPSLSIDPVVMAAQAVTALQTIRSRNLPALEPSVVTVGIIRGGERFNIIPGQVRLEGTVRTYDREIQATVERRMGEILDGITRAGGGSFTLDYRNQAPPTINDPDLTARARRTFERVLGADRVVTPEPSMAGEDFAFFADEVPGVYFRLGVVEPGTESGALHTPTFRAADGSVPVGIRAMASVVADILLAGRSTDPEERGAS
ncbi:MAG: M20 family metallopeptidase [Acidobacteriota bacterium]|jgi:amidohydrolase